jgi:hypothetical protein
VLHRWVQNVNDGINAVRRMLGQSLIDPLRCDRGLKALRNYRKEWDEDRATFRDKPFHNWASHGADAFRSFCARVCRAGDGATAAAISEETGWRGIVDVGVS